MDTGPSNEDKVRRLLQREVAEKSAVGSISFFVFAATVFFYAFNLRDHAVTVKSLALAIVINSLFRYRFSRKYLSDASDQTYTWLKTTVLFNAVCWGIIFSVSALELHFTGTHFVVLVLILTSFTSGSLTTLSYDPWLYFPFQLFTIFPLIVLSFLSGETVLGIIFCYGMLFQVRSYREYRAPLLGRFDQQLELEASNSSLRISQNALIDQTTKLIHTSRLAAIGEMARGLSHEINNSLMSITASTDLIERNNTRDAPGASRIGHGVKIIRDSVRKTAGVIEGLRYFSLEKDAEKKESVLLEDILDKALSLSKEMLKAHSVRLEITGNTELLVYCRTVQVAQILFTIIQNAYEAQLHETDRWIRIEVGNTDEFIFLSLSNGGRKIPEDVSMKLFQPFFTTKDVGLTTGLSLSIARGIANEHGGDIYLDRSREHTTFVVKLPMVKPLSLPDYGEAHLH